jgi:hypothetical protein
MNPIPNRRLVEETITRRVYREDLDTEDDTDDLPLEDEDGDDEDD